MKRVNASKSLEKSVILIELIGLVSFMMWGDLELVGKVQDSRSTWMAWASRRPGIWLWIGKDGGDRYEPLLLRHKIDR